MTINHEEKKEENLKGFGAPRSVVSVKKGQNLEKLFGEVNLSDQSVINLEGIIGKELATTRRNLTVNELDNMILEKAVKLKEREKKREEEEKKEKNEAGNLPPLSKHNSNAQAISDFTELLDGYNKPAFTQVVNKAKKRIFNGDNINSIIKNFETERNKIVADKVSKSTTLENEIKQGNKKDLESMKKKHINAL